MREIINLQFRYTEDEYVAATRLYLRRTTELTTRLVVCFLYSIACIFLVTWLDLGSELLLLFAFATLLPPLIVLLLFFVVPRHRFRHDPKYADEYFLRFSDGGIQFKTAQIDSLLQWSLYTKVLEDERFYVLIYGKNMISVIPKRAFASAGQEAAFDALLRRQLPARVTSKRLAGRGASQPENSYVPPASPPDWR